MRGLVAGDELPPYLGLVLVRGLVAGDELPACQLDKQVLEGEVGPQPLQEVVLQPAGYFVLSFFIQQIQK